ncbi:hypothetical protein ACFVTZ_09365 [Cellulosimicrobium cellulans]|uniref:hypothetical protein n=1 Tax=Cellulosimicrobium cellulans TaxID=1710 RepID=UPI0036E44D29
MTTDHGDVSRDGAAAEPDEPALDVAETLRLIREQQDRARDATEPDARLLFLAWGVAWLVGYLCLWASAVHGGAGTGSMAGAQPEPWAFWVFFSLIAAAIAFTIVHTVTRTVGTRGVSARQGTLYGWAWTLGFVSYGFVLGGLARAGASEEVMALASNAFACVVVGLLYLGGGVAFCEQRLYAVGVWILLVAGVATIAGLPLTYLVMGALGGGGFLVMAVVEHVLKVRRRRLTDGVPPAPVAGEGAADA